MSDAQINEKEPEKTYTALEFAEMNGFSERDRMVVKKMFGNVKASVGIWSLKLKNKFKF